MPITATEPRARRHPLVRAGRVLFAAVLSAGIAGCALFAGDRGEEAKGPSMRLKQVGFADLPGWSEDTPGEAVTAWRLSCARLERRGDSEPMSVNAPLYGRVGDWRRACIAANTFEARDHERLRAFAEAHFVPVMVASGDGPDGLFTGYYEPELRGAREASGRYRIPIRAVPEDLVQVDLGRFRPALKGERLAGRVENGRLTPYESRAEIQNGAIAHVEEVLAWVDSPVDAFFLHIQGSGRIRLADGSVMRVGYAGHNGHNYTAIGKVLIDRGELTRENVSMQSIRAWLRDHPGEASQIMAENASYIFFRELDVESPDQGPLGAEGLPLTAGRSLAVDARFHAYGVPVWLVTSAPVSEETDTPIRRLMIAQDTGGAIRGPVRGDVFWGAGDGAGEIAGRMKHKGQLYVLLPRPLVERLGLPDRGWTALEDLAPAGASS